jgi:catechol 2,3-dioxygenase-like lactoylglutathione lyase family enzyme
MKARSINQVGYVVRDLDEALSFWLEATGAGPFVRMEDYRFENWTYQGQFQDMTLDIAFGQSGDLMIELIQPRGSWPCVYGNSRPQAPCVLHHFGYLVRDPEAAGKALDGHLVTSASIDETAELRYFDCRGSLGTFVELISDTPSTRGFFELSEQLCRDWDGQVSPVRTMEEAWP